MKDQLFNSLNDEQAAEERQERNGRLRDDPVSDKDRAAMEAQKKLDEEKNRNYGAGLDDMDRLYDRIIAYRNEHGPSAAHRKYGELWILAERHRGDFDEYCG